MQRLLSSNVLYVSGIKLAELPYAMVVRLARLLAPLPCLASL